MRLLILTSNPNRASFRQRIDAYIPQMEAAGISCEVREIPSGTFARWRLFATAMDFDGVMVHKKGLRFWDAKVLRKRARHIIYNYDDAVWLSQRRPHKNTMSRFAPWRRMVGMADMVLVGSEDLADHGRRYNANVRVLPLGLESAEYRSDVPKAEDGKIRLVWIGSQSSLGYLREISPQLDEIGRRYPNVILRQICDTFLDMANMEVERFLWQADKRGEYLATCDIGIAPLPDDPFTRGKCSFKVLEYAAAGLPVVASPVGTNVEHVVDGETGFLAHDHDEWIAHLARLIEDASLRSHMGESARRYAATHDISVIGAKFVDLIRECLVGTAH